MEFPSNPHFQTAWQPLFRRAVPVRVSAEVWETADGEALDVDVLTHRPDAPGVLVLHGLEASSRASYVRGMLLAIDRAGWNGAALNLRGCGPSGLRLPRTYHSGFTEDVVFAMDRLRERWPSLAVVGFSLGANLTIKYLGEMGERALAVAGVAISTPFDLEVVAHTVDGPGFWSHLYRERFLTSLRGKARRIARDHPGVLARDALRDVRTMEAFDQAVTVPIHGFADARDYWARNSARAFLGGIRRPTLLISADDDPMIPAHTIPDQAIGSNASLTLERSARGGHVGFIEGSLWRATFSAEHKAIEFLRAIW